MSETNRILIVEDDPDLSEMLQTFFQKQGYEVLTAAWGRDALAISRQETLNLAVLDIRLPDISGFDICRELRSQRKTKDLPIIFLTEKRERVDKLHGLELGVVDYITKPFDINELRLRVRNAIFRAQQQPVVNPVTDLPEVGVLDEHLYQLPYNDTPWALLVIGVNGLGAMREQYGFVAADDMLRALTLIVKNTLREYGSDEDYLGHLSSETLAAITQSDVVATIRERIEARVSASLPNFYGPADRDADTEQLVSIRTGIIDYQTPLPDEIETLKTQLLGMVGVTYPPAST